MSVDIAQLKLSVFSSLISHILPSLRRVVVELSGNHLIIHAFYEGIVGFKERELIDIAATEVQSDFPDSLLVDINVERVDGDEFPPVDGFWAYERYEGQYDQDENFASASD